MPKKRMKETELASYLIPWLRDQHYEVYQEVAYGDGAIDILAVRGIVTWAMGEELHSDFEDYLNYVTTEINKELDKKDAEISNPQI